MRKLRGAEWFAVQAARCICIAFISAAVYTGAGSIARAETTTESRGMAKPQWKGGGVRVADLNYDGWDDLYFQDKYDSEGNIPCHCMLWNQQSHRFEYSITLNNVETDPGNQWISCRNGREEGGHTVIYYRYDRENRLHMVRYVEKNPATDVVFGQLDLTYVEDGGAYTLEAVEDEGNLNLTMIAMAKQALKELYEWTGQKVDTACFQVSDLGGVVFGLSPEDIEHSRIFYSRYFGADTEYNLSGYDKSISSFDVCSARSAWYSPVLWNILPENIDSMADEEVVIWYFERMPGEDAGKVKSIEQRFVDMWTVQTEHGKWFEVVYDAGLREVFDITGPYPEYPVH
ncbi:MAG: hypothetical protein K2G19_02410 [Lachnospiraceae bacterium]|nr:hypothetical protein [Lachnospiraceae bacterium]